MTTYDIKRLALVQAVMAELEGMKIKNAERLQDDMSPAYPEDHFYDKAYELRDIAAKHDEQL